MYNTWGGSWGQFGETNHFLPKSGLKTLIFAVMVPDQLTSEWAGTHNFRGITKGSLQIEFLEKIGNLAQLRGGGQIPIVNPCKFWQLERQSWRLDIWDTDYNSNNWEPEFMTIFGTWQSILTLDSICNSCDVLLSLEFKISTKLFIDSLYGFADWGSSSSFDSLRRLSTFLISFDSILKKTF